MSERLRYEHAERVRDFYREQGRKQERERIVELLMQLPVSEATYKLIQQLKGKRNVELLMQLPVSDATYKLIQELKQELKGERNV
jgi:ABC-type phosphate/phosphonate transport system substrate-binding protein